MMSPPLSEPLIPMDFPQAVQPSSKGKILKVGASLAVMVGSIAGRVYSTLPALNAVSSIAIGLGAQFAINSLFNDDCISRVEQVSLSTFSQVSVFFLSYLWSNYAPLQATAVSGIGVILGGALAVYGNHYRKRWFNRVDSLPSPAKNVRKFSPDFPTFLPEKAKVLYPLASAACVASWFFLTDVVAKGICSFGATFYGAQFASQIFSNQADQKIIQASREALNKPVDSYEPLPRSKWRVMKGSLNSLAPLVIPLMWIPWGGDAQSPERMHQLWIVGLVTGLFDGFLWKSQENRFKNKPINDLDELKMRNPESRCVRTWKIAWGCLVHVGMAAILVRELTSSRNEPKDKIAIGTMYAGFAFSAIKNLAIHSCWNLKKRIKVQNPTACVQLKDRLVIQQMLPRFLGLAPAYIYLLLTNSIAMHSGEPENKFHQGLNAIAWYFYGQGMENEFHQAWGERKGLLHFPLMGAISAVLMTIKEIQGKLS